LFFIIIGSIWCFGGKSELFQPLSSAERYDPSFSRWTQVAPMNKARSNMAAAVFKELIYVTGRGVHYETLRCFGIFRNLYFESRLSNPIPKQLLKSKISWSRRFPISDHTTC